MGREGEQRARGGGRERVRRGGAWEWERVWMWGVGQDIRGGQERRRLGEARGRGGGGAEEEGRE